MPRLAAKLVRSFALVFATAASAAGQCLDWQPGFGSPWAGPNGLVDASIVFDAGNGPALFVAGSFSVAGDPPANGVAKWNGSSWESIPLLSGLVQSLCSFDEHGTTTLFAAGNIPSAGHVLRYAGNTWQTIGTGTNGPVEALAVYDDGSGEALYAAGLFNLAGGKLAKRIARWDGTSWSDVGGGIGGLQGSVSALAVYDAGTGPELYAGGRFTTNPEFPYSWLARWDGTSWNPVGLGLDGPVLAMHVLDDGSGAKLILSGSFTTASPFVGPGLPNGIATWDGTTFRALAGGCSISSGVLEVRTLATADLGSGPSLVAGGNFDLAGGVPASRIASWDGTGWSPVGSGFAGSIVCTIAEYDGGSGPELFAGGMLGGFGALNHLQRWDGSAWSAVGVAGAGANDDIYALATFDDGSGPVLYAAGDFTMIGGTLANRVARWNGSSWSPLGAGLDGHPDALAVYDDGSGPALYAAGKFTAAGGVPANRIARWDGSSWSALGTGITGLFGVYTLAVFDSGSGPELYAGGQFNSAGGSPAPNIARWNGSSWSPVGAGTNSAVWKLRAIDLGDGPALYAAGTFTQAGDGPASKIARWNGAHWSPLGAGLPGGIGGSLALAGYDAGTGPRLYASHNSQVYSWDGVEWTAIGSTAGSFYDMAVFDDGGGPALFAGGQPTLMKWKGAGWSAVPGGFIPDIRALLVADDLPSGSSALFVGGDFIYAGTTPSARLAAWRACAGPVDSFCAGDGSLAACPCANSGASGRGCENSTGTGGALLTSSGTTDPDTLVLDASGGTPTGTMVFLQGSATIAASVFGDGLRCVGGTLLRLYVEPATGGAASAPTPGDPSITARSLALGSPLPPGSVRYYQVYYRDPAPGFCPDPEGKTWNVSNGLAVAW